jgi:fengycin family lipopeptide synthetase B
MNKNNYIANLDEIIFINEIVENKAIKYSNNIALSYKNESLTYFELNKKADLLAKEFLSLGLAKNDFIGIIFNHSIDLIISLLAILKIGACYIPIDPFSPKDRIEFIIEDSSPKAIIIQNKLTNFSFLENKNTVHNIFNDNKLVFIEKPSSVLNKDDLAYCINNFAYIIYTSGSTGKPKGTKISHKNVLSLFESCEKVFSNLNEKDKWVLFHSFAFDYSIWEIWGCFYFGAELLIIDKELTSNFEPFYKEICEKNITVLNQTPSAFNYFSREAVNSNLNHNLKYLVLSGEALDISLLEKWFEKFGDKNTEIINSYGITETTVFVTFRKIFLEDLEKKSRSPIGTPLPHLTCYVLDKNKNILPNGVSGELFVGGLGVSSGYLNRDELTKERFIDNPFGEGKLYKTGDHVRVINNQELEFLGRLDNQVKIRGFRIELGEIENNLNNIEGITESVVIIKEDKITGNYLVAYILEEKNNTISKEEIKNLLRLKMPEVMIPNIYIKVESFPLNNNGKIDKKLLPEDKNSIISDKKEYISPKNQIEKQIYQVLAELLKTEKISIHDNFFDMGAHSLLMVEAHKKIQDITKLKFELIEMFNYPTIHSFSNYLRTKNTEIKAKKNVLIKKNS